MSSFVNPEICLLLSIYRNANAEVSGGLNKFQTCTAFTKNRNLHAVCSTDWLGLRRYPRDVHSKPIAIRFRLKKHGL